MTPTTTYMDITPRIAEVYLSGNTANRPINAKRVNEYARAMRAGQWRTTNQGIGISRTGVLVDGQHRLHAVIESGVCVKMAVTTGLDEDVFDVIDTGRTRSDGDVLSIVGLKDYNLVAAAAKFILHYRAGTPRPWPRSVHSRKEIREFAEPYAPYFNELGANLARLTARRLGASPSAILAAHFVLTDWGRKWDHHEPVSDWWKGLETGAGLPDGDARLALHSWIRSSAMQFNSIMRSELTFLLALRAFQAHIAGESMLRMVVRDPSGLMVRLPMPVSV